MMRTCAGLYINSKKLCIYFFFNIFFIQKLILGGYTGKYDGLSTKFTISTHKIKVFNFKSNEKCGIHIKKNPRLILCEFIAHGGAVVLEL